MFVSFVPKDVVIFDAVNTLVGGNGNVCCSTSASLSFASGEYIYVYLRDHTDCFAFGCRMQMRNWDKLCFHMRMYKVARVGLSIEKEIEKESIPTGSEGCCLGKRSTSASSSLTVEVKPLIITGMSLCGLVGWKGPVGDSTKAR